MGRGRGASAKSNGKVKKKGLSCPGGACYLDTDSDTESVCSDSECSDCFECPAAKPRGSRSRRTAAAVKSKSKASTTTTKSKSGKPSKKKKQKKSKRRTRDSSTSCSCSDCMGYSSSSDDDSYNCPPARGRKCSTC